MTLQQFLDSTLGKTELGTNPSDKGECLGYISLYWQQVLGVLYPINGAEYAKEMIDKPNTSNLLTQIRGTQGIQKGDVIVWGAWSGNIAGHIAIYLEPRTGGFLSQDQNWVHHTVTREVHNFSNVIGYIKVKGDEMTPEQLAELKKLRQDVEFMRNVDFNGNVYPAMKKLRTDVDWISNQRINKEIVPAIEGLKAKQLPSTPLTQDQLDTLSGVQGIIAAIKNALHIK